jgi:magnesium-transporting ATPase (P-type)
VTHRPSNVDIISSSTKGITKIQQGVHNPTDFNTKKQTIGVSDDQLLLKGSVLKNAKYAIGVVVYTGKESKVQMNSQGARSKMSNFEWRLNLLVGVFFVVNFIVVIVHSIVEFFIENRMVDDHKYLFFVEPAGYKIILNFFGAFVFYSYLIPISLFVSVELARLFQAFFMGIDEEMMDPERIGVEGRAFAKTSKLNEELGMIQHIFCDKTGTLTQNKMVFKSCSFGKNIYESGDIKMKLNGKKQIDGDEEDKHEKQKGSAEQRYDLIDLLYLFCLRDCSAAQINNLLPPQQYKKELKKKSGVIIDQSSPSSSSPLSLSPSSPKTENALPLWNLLSTGKIPAPEKHTEEYNLYHFLNCLVLCHECVPELRNEEKERLKQIEQKKTALKETKSGANFLSNFIMDPRVVFKKKKTSNLTSKSKIKNQSDLSNPIFNPLLNSSKDSMDDLSPKSEEVSKQSYMINSYVLLFIYIIINQKKKKKINL